MTPWELLTLRDGEGVSDTFKVHFSTLGRVFQISLSAQLKGIPVNPLSR